MDCLLKKKGVKFLKSHDSPSNEPLILKIGSGTLKLLSIVHFWSKLAK